MPSQEYIKHIQHTHERLKGVSWCGRLIVGWAFMNLDHAAYSNLGGDRLLPCRSCVKAATKALSMFTGDSKQDKADWATVTKWKAKTRDQEEPPPQG